MIVAERKPFDEIYAMIKDYKTVLILGCGTCVTVCMAGGEKEVGILAEQIRLYEKDFPKEKKHIIIEAVVERQCEREFFEPIKDKIAEADCILSMACGVGVQNATRVFGKKEFYPCLNTEFFGALKEPGVWDELCRGCGKCILELTGGICPIARCSKSLLNGPCGGSQGGKCEVNSDIDCVWQLIYDHFKELGKLDELENLIVAKDWSNSGSGGPRKVIREDLKKNEGR